MKNIYSIIESQRSIAEINVASYELTYNCQFLDVDFVQEGFGDSVKKFVKKVIEFIKKIINSIKELFKKLLGLFTKGSSEDANLDKKDLHRALSSSDVSVTIPTYGPMEKRFKAFEDMCEEIEDMFYEIEDHENKTIKSSKEVDEEICTRIFKVKDVSSPLEALKKAIGDSDNSTTVKVSDIADQICDYIFETRLLGRGITMAQKEGIGLLTKEVQKLEKMTIEDVRNNTRNEDGTSEYDNIDNSYVEKLASSARHYANIIGNLFNYLARSTGKAYGMYRSIAKRIGGKESLDSYEDRAKKDFDDRVKEFEEEAAREKENEK